MVSGFTHHAKSIEEALLLLDNYLFFMFLLSTFFLKKKWSKNSRRAKGKSPLLLRRAKAPRRCKTPLG